MKISCIIPAYNEGARIGRVLETVTACPLIDEIIVVDDGSKDDTPQIATAFPGVKFLAHKINRGKSAAICTGLETASGEFVVLIDSDLVGLKVADLTKLIEPVIDRQAQVSISLRRNAPRFWHWIGLDYISGERVLPRRLIAEQTKEILRLPRFGLEVFMNKLIIREKLKIAVVFWPEVDSPFKYKKYGFWKGIKGELGMLADIFRTVGLFGPVRQIVAMRNLRVPGETAKKITKLSFIVPAYNEEARLGKCLESILAATANFSVPTEIIVVNNASTDKTKEVARSYPGIIVVDEPRKGLPSARQAGHLASTGEIEAHIDADTLMSPGWPEKVAIEFAKNPNLVALSGPYIYYDMSLLIRAGVKIWYGFAYLLHFVNHRVLKIGAIVQGGNFAVRKTALEKIGGFNLDAGFYSEDADLARRIQSTGRVKFTFFLPLKTSGRRFRGDGLFKTGWNYAVNHFWTMYRHRPFSREYKDIRLK